MKRTDATLRVAAALMDQPHAPHWGYQTSKSSGVRPGTLYPILNKFLEEGWLAGKWENPEEISGRPPRRYYELTAEGMSGLRALLASAAGTRFSSAPLRPARGLS